MVIKIKVKEVYGQALVYHVDESTPEAKAIMRLTGRRTITPRDYEDLLVLGFTFEEAKVGFIW